MRAALFTIVLAWACNVSAQGDAPRTLLAGDQLLEMASSDVGVVRMVMRFDVGDSTFSAATRPHADRDILGGTTAWLARLFTDDFNEGRLMRIVNGRLAQHGDTLLLRGVATSALGNFHFIGTLLHDTLRATLTNARHEPRGTIRGWRHTGKTPLRDYPALVARALDTLHERLYDPRLLQSGDQHRFEKHMREIASRAQDDLELVFGFFHRARKLPYSHIALWQPLPSANGDASVARSITLEDRSPGVAVLRIPSFGGSAAEMDSLFGVIVQRGYSDLIVDLRGNPGGTVAAGLAFAQHVADSAWYGGLFLTRRWWVSHAALPTTTERAALPRCTEANYDLLIQGIHHEEGLRLEVVPAPPHYTGRLFVLTDGNTASTCEPIVHGLHYHQRAVIIGERTAGAMLNGEAFPIGDGFQLIVPTADYYAADGRRLDQRGVEPDIKVSGAKALEVALQRAAGR